MTVDIRQMDAIARLRASLATTAYTSGTTHHFYHYPARFHPLVAREVVSAFSKPGEWILDPFMGGGTSIIEGLTLARRMIGSDINALATFVANVRTRPLSAADEDAISNWARTAAAELTKPDTSWIPRPGILNLPSATEVFLAGALELSQDLAPRRRAFCRAVLLRLGQWALDCRDFRAPRRSRLADRLPQLVKEMIGGLTELVDACEEGGLGKRSIVRSRVLLNCDAAVLHENTIVRSLKARPRLVFTSPPYPGVHVLYHRWQYRGRKETAAPYWIANVSDGLGTSHYCGGSRTPTGLQNYFAMIVDAFSSVSKVMHKDGRVVQIVGFSNVREQFPLYLEAMERAGFTEVSATEATGERLERRVANRKWYAKLQGDVDAATEFLLVHRHRASQSN